MSDPIVTPEPVSEEPVEVTPEPVEVTPEPELGDAGKKAIDAMKEERNVARNEKKAIAKELADIRAELANKDKPAEEKALDEARAEARAEATKAADARYIKSELKAAATGKLADPTDAALYINLDDFEVDDNGDVDSDALADAIAELLTRKPHLGVPDARKFQGSGDQGAKKTEGVTQLTREQLKTMSPQEIMAAQKAGQLTSIL